jgi:hypothetical protein
MLSWLRRRHESATSPPQKRAGAPVWRVTCDDQVIQLSQPNGTQSDVAWAQLGSVGIMTTPDGPASPDLFWILQTHDRKNSMVVPMGADGEQNLLHAMQARLPGFDNMTVIEAMSSVEAAGFVVWQASDVREDPISAT